MSDYVYTKAALISRSAKHMPAELSPGAQAEISDHLALKHPNADALEFATLFVRACIIENDWWPRDAELEYELRDFLLAIRKGNVDLKGANAVAYADAYRDWKRASRYDTAAQPRENPYRDELNLPTALTPANYAAEYEQCFIMRLLPGDTLETPVQNKRCLRDVLEGIENYFDEDRTRSAGDFAAGLRQRYAEAERLWARLTGNPWVRNQPRQYQLQYNRRAG